MNKKVLDVITNILGFFVALPALILLYVGKGLKFIGELSLKLGDKYVEKLEQFVEYTESKIN